MAKRKKTIRQPKGRISISVLADGETWTRADVGSGCHVAVVKTPPEGEDFGDADDFRYLRKWDICWRLGRDGSPEPYFREVAV